MHLFNRMVAITLAGSLLFPAPLTASAQTKDQKSLAQYQKEVREDIEQSPWIKQGGKVLLGVGGATVGFLVAREITANTLKAQNRDLQIKLNNERLINKKLSSIYQYETTTKENTLKYMKKQLNNAQRQIRHQTNQIDGLTAVNASLQQKNEILNKNLEELTQRFKIKKQHYMNLVRYPQDFTQQFTAYEKLFDINTGLEERAVLLKRLAQEPWLQNVTEAQRKEFLEIVRRSADLSMSCGKLSSTEYIRFLIRQAVSKNMPTYDRLIGLCRHIFHANNLPAITILVALGLASQKADAQKWTGRIQQNFDLFINATPEELEKMEQDPEVRKVCIDGADTYHMLSIMPQEGKDILFKYLTNMPSSDPADQIRSNPNHLAR